MRQPDRGRGGASRIFAAPTAATCLRSSIPAGASAEGHDRPNPGALKWLWRERRCSSEALDQSGVWRFRELLPILDSFGNAVIAARGQHAALSSAARGKGAGHRSALRQAPGHESDGLVQRHGHDGGAERGARSADSSGSPARRRGTRRRRWPPMRRAPGCAAWC